MATQSALSFCDPMLAKLVKVLPEGPLWQYEVKWDGYRIQAIKDGQVVRLFSRRSNDFTRRFARVPKAVAGVKAEKVILDGEVVAIDEQGKPSFQMLQNRSGSSGSLVFYAFDLLNFEGQDWRRKPLTERQSKLAQVVKGSTVRVSPPLAGSAAVVISAVREHGLEGVVAKRKDSFYQPGERSGARQKLPLKPKDEFVIGGYRLADKKLEVLLVGRFEGAKLLFAGKVHQGLNQFNRKTLLNTLRPLSVAECPFANLPSSRHGRFGEGVRAEEMGEYSWVKPKIMATIKFAEWTDAGVLRHAEFEDLVTDDDNSELGDF
jgi:DNA ligase D-like protein (predicted ligase)